MRFPLNNIDMADVTINQLTGQAPTSTDVFPFSTTGVTPSTYKATLAQIKTGLGLATVATTGSYNDLSSKPTIPTAVSQLTNDSGYITSSSLPTYTTPLNATGTAVDFSGFSSAIKEFKILLNGVGSNGFARLLVQIGSGSLSTSGYKSHSGVIYQAGATNEVRSTSGFITELSNTTCERCGHIIITRLSSSSNVYICSHVLGDYSADASCVGGGNITLNSVLDRIRITTDNGTDQFNKGSINILYTL